MPRKPRLHVPGGLYHVTLRGNDGQSIFLSAADRRRFETILAEGLQRYDHRVHAFCWMTNHVHLAVQPSDTPLFKLIHVLASRYARWFNRRRGRRGHLFQDRYHPVLVDAESYLLEVVRYIHLNPVRAGMVRRPSAYRWSSHRAYLGEVEIPWLTTSLVLSHFAEQRGPATARYRDFIAGALEQQHARELVSNPGDPRVVGDDGFLERLGQRERTGSRRTTLEEIERSVCAHLGVLPAALADRSRLHRHAQARALIAWLAVDTESASLTEVAARYQRDDSTLCKSIARYGARFGLLACPKFR